MFSEFSIIPCLSENMFDHVIVAPSTSYQLFAFFVCAGNLIRGGIGPRLHMNVSV